MKAFSFGGKKPTKKPAPVAAFGEDGDAKKNDEKVTHTACSAV